MNEAAEHLDLAYQQAYRQVAEQSDEIERLDRKATALLTPIGLLIGLGINVGVRQGRVLPVTQAVFYIGLLVLLAAMFAGIVVLWPREFRRVSPGRPAQLSPPNSSTSWLRRTFVDLGAEGPHRQRVREWEQLQFDEPEWSKETLTDTAAELIEQLTAVWRINSVLLGPKSRWLTAEFVFMLVGAVCLAGWYVFSHG